MKKFDFGRLFDNKRFSVVFSILLAVACWFFVVYQIDTSTTKTIRDIQVEVNLQQMEMLEASGLDVMASTLPKVKAELEGERVVLRGLDKTDVRVEANLSGITAAGTYDVNLVGYDINDNGFTITKIVPDKITVKVVRPATRKFAVTTDIEGLATPEDYLRLDTMLNPKEVEISGAEVDVNKIDKCVVSVKFTDPLTSSTTRTSEIKLYDVEGNELSKELFTIDHDTVDVTIPVYKMAWVPLTFQYSRVPNGLPVEELSYQFIDGEDKLQIAAPENMIDTYQEISLGYVNINEIQAGGYQQLFDVSLSTGVINVNKVTQVGINFATEDFEEVTFTVDNIKVLNAPSNYDVEVNTQQISGVTLVGPPDILASLSPDDLIAEIDLSDREISPGPSSLAVRIVVPGGKLVWAVGDYSAVVVIREQE